MKKLLVLFVLLLTASVMFADVDFYGNARFTYFYNMKDEDMTGIKDGKLVMNYKMQSNSRFGAKFSNDMFTGRLEIGTNANMRLLYGEYKMDMGTLLVGQAGNLLYSDGSYQAWGEDWGHWGYGSASGDRVQQVKFTHMTGLSFALIKPMYLNPNDTNTDGIDMLIPTIELGYNGKIGETVLVPSLMMAMESYNEDVLGFDGTTMAWIFNLRTSTMMNDLRIGAEFHYGANTGNLGIWSATENNASWDAENNEVQNTTDMGFLVDFGYPLSEMITCNAGFGYQMTNNDDADWTQEDTAMAFYANAKVKLAKQLCLTPEIGMIDEMEDNAEITEGKNIYFGTKLQLDF